MLLKEKSLCFAASNLKRKKEKKNPTLPPCGLLAPVLLFQLNKVKWFNLSTSSPFLKPFFNYVSPIEIDLFFKGSRLLTSRCDRFWYCISSGYTAESHISPLTSSSATRFLIVVQSQLSRAIRSCVAFTPFCRLLTKSCDWARLTASRMASS